MTNKNKKRPTGYRAPAATKEAKAARARVSWTPCSRRGSPAHRPCPRSPRPCIEASSPSPPRRSWWSPRSWSSSWSGSALVAFGSQGPFADHGQPARHPAGGLLHRPHPVDRGVRRADRASSRCLGFIVVRARRVRGPHVHGRSTCCRPDGVAMVVGAGGRILPIALSVNIGCLGLLVMANFIGPLLGSGFGLLILMAALVGGIYLLGFATTIAGDRATRARRDDGSLSARRRTPGAGNLTFAALYVLTSVAVSRSRSPGRCWGSIRRSLAWAIVLRRGVGPHRGDRHLGLPLPQRRPRGARCARAGARRPEAAGASPLLDSPRRRIRAELTPSGTVPPGSCASRPGR